MPLLPPASRPVRTALWSAVGAWAIAIFVASSLPGGGRVPLPGPGYDKLVHAAVYLGLGALVALALRADGRSARSACLLALLAGVAYGGTDELHQRFVPHRECALDDLVADALGVALGVLAAGPLARRLPAPATEMTTTTEAA
jgi:VanZ family protein